MNQPPRRGVLRKVGLSSAIAVTVLVGGVGVASASTHSSTAVFPAAVQGSNAVGSNDAGTNAPLMPPRGPGGISGDVKSLTDTSFTIVNIDRTASTYAINASTTITNLRHRAGAASLAVGENVLVVPNSSDSGVAGSIAIVPANIAGRVSAVNGDAITVTSPNGSVATILVSSATTYAKAGVTVSFGDVSVGSFVFAEGSVGSSPTTIDAATVGIGMPGPSNGKGPGPFLGVPPGPVPEFRSNTRGVTPK
jgi:hypothetical protein